MEKEEKGKVDASVYMLAVGLVVILTMVYVFSSSSKNMEYNK